MDQFAIMLLILCVLLFLGMLGLMEYGRRLGLRQLQADPEGRAGLSTIDAALFATLGLLVAFTFSNAANRFDARRKLIVDEANAIGTTWLRLSLVPAEERRVIQDLMREYVAMRIKVYQTLPDETAARQWLDRSTVLQNQIWDRATAAVKNESPANATLLLGSLNEMIDVTTTRGTYARFHPPRTIFTLLFILALCCSLLAGHAMAGSKVRSLYHMAAFAGITVLTIYVTLELEYPRSGLIRIDSADYVLEELEQSMQPVGSAPAVPKPPTV